MKQEHLSKGKGVELSFPPDASGEPLVCRLVRDYGLMFNILKARITPRKEGRLTLDLIGEARNIEEGIAYLKAHGVKVTGMARRVSRKEAACMHCGMCTALCAADALRVESASRLVSFFPEQCVACGHCVRICPVHAMSMDIRQDNL